MREVSTELEKKLESRQKDRPITVTSTSHVPNLVSFFCKKTPAKPNLSQFRYPPERAEHLPPRPVRCGDDCGHAGQHRRAWRARRAGQGLRGRVPIGISRVARCRQELVPRRCTLGARVPRGPASPPFPSLRVVASPRGGRAVTSLVPALASRCRRSALLRRPQRRAGSLHPSAPRRRGETYGLVCAGRARRRRSHGASASPGCHAPDASFAVRRVGPRGWGRALFTPRAPGTAIHAPPAGRWRRRTPASRR